MATLEEKEEQLHPSEEDNSPKMFGPLNFESNAAEKELHTETQCLLCEDKFNLKNSFKLFLRHVFDVHHLVIEEVQHIENLDEYLEYWRRRFAETEMQRIVPSVTVETADNKFFLLSSLIKEDKDLRHKIRLEHTLKIQEFERTDTNYDKKCLLCRFNFQGSRPDYLQHLSEQHNLQLGNPQNLVYIDELIEKINEKLDSFHCIFCERLFPDKIILKEHMRKKIHKRINPDNKSYDKYYIVNYLEVDKNWTEIEKEGDMLPIEADPNSDEEYDDWNEKEDEITCLFCKVQESDIDKICDHMSACHDLDFSETTKEFDFYQKIKLVNYVRKQVHSCRCVFCDAACENADHLSAHMGREKHYRLPDVQTFNQPEFYFPTYENDAFLYLLEDVED